MTFQKYYKSKANAVRALQRRGFYTINFQEKQVTGYKSIFVVQFKKTRKGWRGKAL